MLRFRLIYSAAVGEPPPFEEKATLVTESKILLFFRDHALKKRPLWGSQKPRNPPPVPPFEKGGPGGIYRDSTANFLFTTAKCGFGIPWAMGAQDHLQLGWSMKPVFSLPGRKGRRRSPEGPGLKPLSPSVWTLLLFMILHPSKRTPGG